MDSIHVNQFPTEIEDLESVSNQTDPRTPQKAVKLEDIVRDVLDTRPAVLAARAGGTIGGGIDRGDVSRWSLPSTVRRKASQQSLRLNRRSRSVHGHQVIKDTTQQPAIASDIIITDIEVEGDTAFQRNEDLRKSSALLRHRLAERRKQTVIYDRGVRASCWADLKYVKWPKIKSRLQVIVSQELWKGHLKEVEGLFGTTVVSYFVFLRWIFIMNVLIFLLWFGMVCIPQFIYQGSNSLNQVSNITCVLQQPLIDMRCSNESLNRTIATVFSAPANCLSMQQEDGETILGIVRIRECNVENEIATSEGGNQLVVSPELIDGSSCEIVDKSSGRYDSFISNTTSYSVCIGVKARVEWYQHILDFISGTGFFNETILFHGVYSSKVGRYDLSLAFLFMTAVIYVVAVLLLVYKMGHAFNESYVEFGSTRKINFCNKLFTAWDFNITDPKTAKLRQAHIRTEFHEELLDLQAREVKRSRKKFALVVIIRFWTNFFVLLTLIGAGAAIYFSAAYELQILQTGVEIPLIGEYLSAIVISILNAILPLVFQLVAKLEQYKTSTGSVRITLIRTVMVRLSSLIVLLGSLFLVISECIQPVVDNGDECTISSIANTFANTSLNITQTCPQCWETFIGQQFYKLGVTNLFVSIISTILIESGRHLSSRVIVHIKWKNLGQKFSRFVTKGNFNIPKSILDLIYTQSLLWLGFLFAPLLPFIVLITSVLLFYVKKYSLIWNLEPDKKGFQRSARTNFIFLFLMLLALFASIIPVLYAAIQLRPSESCGPFRGQETMYQSLTNLVDGGTCTARIVVDFFTSSAFIVPLVIILVLSCYALYVVLKAREARFLLIKKQLILEGANVTHIVGNLNDALQELAETRDTTEQNLPLSEVIKRRSHLLSKAGSEAPEMPLSPHTPDPISPATIDTAL